MLTSCLWLAAAVAVRVAVDIRVTWLLLVYLLQRCCTGTSMQAAMAELQEPRHHATHSSADDQKDDVQGHLHKQAASPLGLRTFVQLLRAP